MRDSSGAPHSGKVVPASTRLHLNAKLCQAQSNNVRLQSLGEQNSLSTYSRGRLTEHDPWKGKNLSLRDCSTVETDVLVIGSGAAGLRAAIAAREAGAQVIITAKAPAGRASCTIYSAGCIALPESSPEAHFRQSLKTGRCLNVQELLWILCEESTEAVHELSRFGAHLEYASGRARAKPHARPLGGLGLIDPLVTYARKIGVRFHAGGMVLALVPDETGAMAGAVSIDLPQGELVLYRAGAVILATGGAGALFPCNDNPSRITGDGYVLAYQAGARLQDLEFVQMYPLGIVEESFPTYLVELGWTDFCSVTNARGEPFFKNAMARLGVKNGHEAARYARDRLARVVGLEIFEGRGDRGAVLMDFSGVVEVECQRDPYLSFLLKKVLRRFPYRERPLHVAPVAHHTMGGVVVDQFGATHVAGLFAAGEVTGGIHGANRQAWNALADAIVFGRRAGKAAARQALKGSEGNFATEKLEQFEEVLHTLVNGKTQNGQFLREFRKKIRTAAQDLHVVRTVSGLRRAIQQFDALKQERLSASTPRQLVTCWELKNLLEIGTLIAHSALARKESRGAHYRLDFPEQNDSQWRRHIVCERRDCQMNLFIAPAR